jgi:hypothetical protein
VSGDLAGQANRRGNLARSELVAWGWGHGVRGESIAGLPWSGSRLDHALSGTEAMMLRGSCAGPKAQIVIPVDTAIPSNNRFLDRRGMESSPLPAGIAIAPNASPPRVISGSPNEPRNCSPSPTAMWFSRFRKHSHRWHYRTRSWCMHGCFVRCLRPCWRSPPIHDASEPRSFPCGAT